MYNKAIVSQIGPYNPKILILYKYYQHNGIEYIEYNST